MKLNLTDFDPLALPKKEFCRYLSKYIPAYLFYEKGVEVMKKLCAILLAATMLFTVMPQGNVRADASEVAVKLVNYIGKNSSIDVKVTGNYRISETGSSLNSGQTYTVKASSGVLSLYSGTQKLKEFGAQFSMVPVHYSTSSTLTIQNGNSYTGTITFQADGSIVTPINKLPMEDYLKGVLPKEVSSSYPLESLKAQAVSARTHASRFSSVGKTIDDTTSYQVYGGYSSWQNKTSQAVDQTAGVVLKYGGTYAQTYFSASNGGMTESAENAWGGSSIPYLTVKRDPYDDSFSWSVTLKKTQISTSGLDLKNSNSWWNKVVEANKNEAANMKAFMQKNGYGGKDLKITGISSLTVDTAKNSSGRSIKGSITLQYMAKNELNPDGSIKIQTAAFHDLKLSQLRAMVGNSIWKSLLVTNVTNSADSYTVSGKGYGHGVGMSQYGMKARGEAGQSYKEILQFYYPGTTLTGGSDPNPGPDPGPDPVKDRINLIARTSLHTAPGGPWDGAISAQTVSVLDKQGDWVKIQTWKGPRWIVPNRDFSLPEKLLLSKDTSMHEKPDSKSAYLGTVSAPQNVSVLSNEGDWYLIETWRGPCWVLPNRNFSLPEKLPLSVNTSLHERPDSTSTYMGSVSAPQQVTVLDKQGDWYLIETWRGPLWILPDHDFSLPSKITLTKVTSLHSEPDGKSPYMGGLSPQNVTVLAKRGAWYLIETWKGPLWILPDRDFSLPEKLSLSLNTSLHERPDSTSAYMGSVSAPQQVTVLDKQGDWYLIETWRGPLWILPNHDTSLPAKITLTKVTSLHNEPNGTESGAVSPQTVTVLAKQNKWYQIVTWKGPLWIVPNQDLR